MTKSHVKLVNSLDDAVNGNRVSHAVTAALILGNKSPSLTSSTRASTPSSINSSCAGTPPSVAPHCVPKVEHCNCCNIDEFRRIYDSFCLMDKRGCGVVQRCDFWEAFTEHLTHEMQCTISKAKLHQRFKSSAAEMTLEELIGRIWPTATDADRKKMNLWARLHDAYLIVSSSSFRGSPQNIKQVFDLMDFDGSGRISLSELVRARILTKAESQTLLQDWYKMFKGKESSQSLNFTEFKLITQKHLIDNYANGLWDGSCRSAVHASKKTDNDRPCIKIANLLDCSNLPIKIVLSRHAALHHNELHHVELNRFGMAC